MPAKKKGSPPPETSRTRVGELFGWFETGTEGVVWSLQEDGKPGYDGLYCLEEGDRLKVWEKETGRSVFDETIRFDWKIGYRPYPLNPQYGQQCALGFWVHGVQQGYLPDEWASLFFRPKGAPSLRAEVTSRPKRGKMAVKRRKS